MALSVHLKEKARAVEGVAQWPYKAIAEALEVGAAVPSFRAVTYASALTNRLFQVIPRTLIKNCGQDTIRTLTKLRAKVCFLYVRLCLPARCAGVLVR